MEMLMQWDVQLFYFIRDSCSNEFWDILLPIIRNKYVWLPFYISIIAYVLTRYSVDKSSYLLLVIIGVVTITDLCSGQILKKYVQRDRPCRSVTISLDSEPLVRCSYSYSFPSAHATNHFGLAMILAFLFGSRRKWLKYMLFGWASLISVAQIYVGVHYPLDIIGGAILGILLVRLYLRLISYWVPRDILHAS